MKKGIQEFKDIHKGQDIYVLGAGASMDYIEPSFFENKITIGINYLWKKFKCNYYVFKDGYSFSDGNPIIDKIIEEGHSIYPNSKIIFSEFVYGGNAGDTRKNECHTDLDYYIFQHDTNICKVPDKIPEGDKIIVGISTITSGIHLAYYMGAKNIILCGHDCCELNGKYYFDGYPIGGCKLNEDNDNLLKLYKEDTLKLKELLGINIYKLESFR